MKIWMATSECSPWAKSGGLGDAVAALGQELARSGHDVRIFLPGYGSIPRELFDHHDGYFLVPVGTEFEPVELRSTETPDGLIITLIESPHLFGRDGLYGEHGSDYPDNDRRFICFSRVVAELSTREIPDILHAHDWQASAALFFARHVISYKRSPPACVLTVHNVGYQGAFSLASVDNFSLPPEQLNAYLSGGPLEYYGRLNLLKTGLLSAHCVNTVSPTHARETLSPEYGFGLDGIFRSLGDRYSGILNGVDTDAWNPETDCYLKRHYGAGSLERKKGLRDDLCLRFGIRNDGPIFGIISRLAWQKGIDLLLAAAKTVLNRGASIIVLGSGEPRIEIEAGNLAVQYPDRAAVHLGFNEELSHAVTAGCDVMVVPSRYEPCGLVQMQAMRYGTLPLAHRTGGLADTITDMDQNPSSGTGFLYDGTWPAALEATLHRAHDVFTKQPDRFRAAQLRAMKRDFSWAKSAKEYEQLYERAGSVARSGH